MVERRKKTPMDDLAEKVNAVDMVLQVHLAECRGRDQAINTKLNWMLVGMGVLTLLSFMGPHDGIMTLLAKLKG